MFPEFFRLPLKKDLDERGPKTRKTEPKSPDRRPNTRTSPTAGGKTCPTSKGKEKKKTVRVGRKGKKELNAWKDYPPNLLLVGETSVLFPASDGVGERKKHLLVRGHKLLYYGGGEKIRNPHLGESAPSNFSLDRSGRKGFSNPQNVIIGKNET